MLFSKKRSVITLYKIERFAGNKPFDTDGYIKKECFEDKAHLYTAFANEKESVFVNYFKNTDETQIVYENQSNYFDFCDKSGKKVVTPQITQLHLEDFGMSYVIRLEDGRFILIDGGWDFSPDADRLFEVLKSSSPHKKPVIALWIMTHPHSDHYRCFFPFTNKYGNDVTIEKFMYNFPDADDTEHYPSLTLVYSDSPSESDEMKRFYEYVKRIGAPVYTAHTGQKYKIGGAELSIIASLDDTYGVTQNINSTSLVIRMTIAGQVILWGADASFEYSKLCKRYGSLLKADILQVMHHGFGGGSAKEEALGYSLIDPDVCLLPVIDYNAYINFCAYKGGARHLMSAVDIKEMITGDETVTLTLPYTPDKSAINVHREKYERGQKSSGADTWVFTGLDSCKDQDFIFDVLNMTSAKANVIIELYFENRANNVTFIRYTAAACSFKSVNITDTNEVSTEDDFYNPNSLQKKGIAKNKAFAVRFLSDIPIVVTHKKHKEAYHS